MIHNLVEELRTMDVANTRFVATSASLVVVPGARRAKHAFILALKRNTGA